MMMTRPCEPRPFRWSGDQYQQMHELGWLAGEKAELIDGEVFVRMAPDRLTKRRWTRDELFQMINLGWFADHRVELIGGELIEMPAQFNLHLAGIDLTADALRLVFGAGFWVRRQGSLDLSPHGVPEPDVDVVHGTPKGATRTMPASALLVVEVSDSSLSSDRHGKGSLYAAGGIADYWILNLVQRQLEVYRNPVVDTSAPFGFRFADRTILDPGDFASPLAMPNARIAVTDLLP